MINCISTCKCEWLLTGFLLFCSLLEAQPYRGSIGLDMANVFLNTYSVRGEYALSHNIMLRASASGRYHVGANRLSFLSEYKDIKNRSVAGTLGITLADHYASTFPYLGIDLNAIYYDDIFKNKSEKLQNNQGFTGGAMLSLGFIMPVWKRISLDISAKFGYTFPVKDERLDYFFPGAGYSLNGISEAFSSKNLTFLPSLAIKYNLFPIKRYKPLSPSQPLDENVLEEEVSARRR